MTVPLTIECDIHVRRLAHGAVELRCGEAAPAAVVPAGQIPRVARLMGVTRRTIYLRLQRYNIPRERVPKTRTRPATA